MILIFSVSYNIHSQEHDADIVPYNDNNSLLDNYNYKQFGSRIIADAGCRILFPLNNSPWYCSTFNFGIGFGIDLVKYVLSPGIYIDLGVGTDWFYVFSDSEEKNEDYVPTQFLLSGGVRVYNYMRIFWFDVIPFIGYNFIFIFIPLPNVGVSIAFRNIPLEIEYAYYFSSYYTLHQKAGHHITVKYTLRESNTPP
jgi:hypothetical protein